jgi:hypothetical protein
MNIKERLAKLEKSQPKINPLAHLTDAEIEAEVRRLAAKFDTMDYSVFSPEQQATIDRLKKQVEELDRPPFDWVKYYAELDDE